MRDVRRIAFNSDGYPIGLKFNLNDGGNFKIGWYRRRLNEDGNGIQ